MTHSSVFEVFGPPQGCAVTVAHRGESHGVMTHVIERYAEPFLQNGTWSGRQNLVEGALNAFFAIDGTTGKPLVFVDRDDGQRAIKLGCEAHPATVTRKGKALLGYDVVAEVAPRRLEDMLVAGENIFDLAFSIGHATVENPFRVKDFNPALEAQLRTARIRQARQDGKEPDYAKSSGRFFVVTNAGTSVPRTEDPHLHRRTRQALVTYNAPPGVLAAWDFKENIWSRPAEAIEAPVGSLHLGAIAGGEDRFGRLAMLADKSRLTPERSMRHVAALGGNPLARELTKLTAQTETGWARVQAYFNGHRKDQDGGRDLRWYEDACRAGDEAAMRRPMFLNTQGGALVYETARRRTFAPIMDLAGLKYGGKRPGMHLGRHDAITRAVERIMALKVPALVKESMLDDLVDFVGWASGRRMLGAYTASIDLIQRAKRRLGFAADHAQPILAGPVPAFEDDDPESLLDLFGDR